MSSPSITVASKTTTSNNNSQEFTTVPIGNENVDNDAPLTKVDSSNSNKDNNNNKEKTPNKMMRGTKNAWRRAVGCCKKSTPRTKIRLKEHQITKRKTAFGIQYMDLVQTQASEEVRITSANRYVWLAMILFLLLCKRYMLNVSSSFFFFTTLLLQELQQAVQACLQDIERVMQEIAELENKIEQVSEETKSKLKQKPTTSTSSSQSTGKKPIYENSGLYSGGDPSIEETDEDEMEEGNNTTNNNKTPPQAVFSIAEEDDDDDDDDLSGGPEKESWDIPAPPSTPPPAVPVVESI